MQNTVIKLAYVNMCSWKKGEILPPCFLSRILKNAHKDRKKMNSHREPARVGTSSKITVKIKVDVKKIKNKK